MSQGISPAATANHPWDPAQVAAWARDLDGRAAEEILAWTFERFGHLKVAATSAFGPEGCVLVELLRRRWPQTPVLTIDTGLLFDAAVAVREAHRARGVRVEVVAPLVSLAQQERTHGPRLYERDPDACCGLRKVAPMRSILRGLDLWLTAVRRDQAPSRADTPVLSLVPRDGGGAVLKVAPMVRWTRKDTWAFLLAHDVPYNALLDQGYTSVGCRPCTAPVDAAEAGDGGERAGRWRGRAKTECGIHEL